MQMENGKLVEDDSARALDLPADFLGHVNRCAVDAGLGGSGNGGGLPKNAVCPCE